jgi:uncharacterized membrane protein YciS (DUF1049 family)
MGRYVVLLTAPFVIGVLIAAGLVVIEWLRHRAEARRVSLELERLERQEDDDPDVTEPLPELRHRRIAS